MRLALFGASGQLGTELVGLAQSREIPLIALGRADADITNPGAVAAALDRHRPEVVVNAAAYTAVDKAESEPAMAEAGNVTGPAVLARACAAAQIPLVHVSTDYVFDGTGAGAYREEDPIAPLGVYGRTKAEGEGAIRDVLERHIIVRTSWVYGVHGRNFLKTILRLAAERDELSVVADQRGCPTATLDLATGLLLAAERAAHGDAPWGTYHLAGQGVTTWHGFAEEIVRAAAPHLGRLPRVKAITTADYPTAVKRPANSELDSSKFERAFGFRAAPWQGRVAEATRTILRNQRS